jgi:hypothetical protein
MQNPAKMNQTRTSMSPTDLENLQTRLNQWQEQHADLESLRAAYRRRLVSLTLHSMAFEQEPVNPEHLQEWLDRKAQSR